MKKYKDYIPTFLMVLFLIICLLYHYLNPSKEKEVAMLEDVTIVPTIISKIENNSIWCSTFQLIWNDLKNEVVKQDIVFEEDTDNQMVSDLNQETFTESDISDTLYYKNFGFMTPSLKQEIEEDIANKFNEESNILDDFTFVEESQEYFFYSMLVRQFNFLYPFDELNEDTFGIISTSKEDLDKNINVLYYNDEKEYAVSLNTKEGDEIILIKTEDKNNFNSIYSKLNLETKEEFKTDDTISIHNFNFLIKQGFEELEGKRIIGDSNIFIQKTLQFIRFELNNEGGRIKSEAGMSVKMSSSSETERHFDFTNNFVLFVKEKDKNLPYFAMNVNNVNDFE